jgi:hypothetical protein
VKQIQITSSKPKLDNTNSITNSQQQKLALKKNHIIKTLLLKFIILDFLFTRHTLHNRERTSSPKIQIMIERTIVKSSSEEDRFRVRGRRSGRNESGNGVPARKGFGYGGGGGIRREPHCCR